MELFNILFDTSGYPPRWHCGHWTLFWGWLHILSNFFIFVAYVGIPIAILYSRKLFKRFRFNIIFLLFAGFIFFCGLTHLNEAILFWYPFYNFAGVVKFFTALISVTALITFIVRLPAISELLTEKQTSQALKAIIKDSKENELNLYQLNVQLENSNAELAEFTYIVSHDLKEPIRGIHNYCKILLEECATSFDEETKRNLERLPKLAKRLEQQIDSLLEYSKLGKLNLTIETVDLNTLINESSEMIEHFKKAKNADIIIKNKLPKVKGDYLKLLAVFTNLISNACKYNDDPHPIIKIGSLPNEADPSKVIIYVKDNGIGIDEEHFQRVFTIFKRLHSQASYGGGTGVGLTIVNKIIKLHDGKIWIESKPGKGSTFYFTLPLSV